MKNCQSFMFLNERDLRENRKQEIATLAAPFITALLPLSRHEKRSLTISSNLQISAAVLPHRGREGRGLQGEVEESEAEGRGFMPR